MRHSKSLSHSPKYPNAYAAMLGQAVTRNALRVFVRLPAWVTVEREGTTEHVAFVRDISPRGIFLYSDWKPGHREHVDFVLQYLSGSNKVRLHFTGTVVRIEQTPANTACGIAVAFDSRHDDVPRFPLRKK
jgi:hypothetical protein